MKYFFIMISLCVVLLPPLAQADQAAYLPKATSDRAVQMLQSHATIRHYYQPCGDTRWTEESINAVQSE